MDIQQSISSQSRQKLLRSLWSYNHRHGLITEITGAASKPAVDALVSHRQVSYTQCETAPRHLIEFSARALGYESVSCSQRQHAYITDKQVADSVPALKLCVAELKNVSVTNFFGFHLVREGSGFSSMFSSAYAPLYKAVGHEHSELKNCVSLDSAALLFDDTEADNYCHLITDYLSKLFYFEQTSSKLTLLVSDQWNQSFNKDVMDLLRSRGHNFIIVPTGTSVHVKNLLAISNDYGFAHPAFRANPATLGWITSALAPKTDSLSNQNHESSMYGVYIPRSRRSCDNESEVLKLLQSRYRIYSPDLSRMTVTDQIDLFSKASLVFGVHGAGFTNMLFMPRNSSVVEFFPLTTGIPTIMILAKTLQVNHFNLMCKTRQTGNANHPNVFVDLEELETLFEKL